MNHYLGLMFRHFFLLILLVANLGSFAQELNDSAKSRAQTILHLIAEEKFGAVLPFLDSAMSRSIDQAGLDGMWTSFILQHGKLNSIGETKSRFMKEFYITLTPMNFETDTFSLQLKNILHPIM
jgi:hypothetical protein